MHQDLAIAEKRWNINMQSTGCVAVVAMFLASSECIAFSPVLPAMVRTPAPGLHRMQSGDASWKERQNAFWENFIHKERQLFYKDHLSNSTTAEGEPRKDPAKASWIGWMSAGTPRTPRGVAEVKMREALELGGVPRSDRYSSR